MEYHCCSLAFNDLSTYFKHLKFHKDNSSLQVKCNECGHCSRSWDAFKRHSKSEHYNDLTNVDHINTNGILSSEVFLTDQKEIISDTSYQNDVYIENNDPLMEAILQKRNQNNFLIFKT